MTDYRFSIEWARIEPAEGEFSQAQLDHYRGMIDAARERRLRPLVTLQHFTVPRWFDARGGWLAPDASELFARYAAAVSPLLEAVDHVCTINEPNVVAVFPQLKAQGWAAFADGFPEPDAQLTAALIAAHRDAAERLKQRRPQLRVGWSVACQSFQAESGAEKARAAHAWPRETVFLAAAERDDWVGVQSYTRTIIGVQPGGGVVVRPAPADAPRTLTGWEEYPEALGIAVRDVAAAIPHVPIIVTENGIATADDQRRIAYTKGALEALSAAMRDGVDVRGYFHWSLLDNYEWGSWAPTFGLVAVDRATFARHPKPSLGWLGSLAPAAR